MKKLLQQLTETFGPSGYEENVRALVRAEVESLADEIKVDALGNLIVRKKPTKQNGDTKKIMIAAHMDEIGLIVSHVDEKGFVRFSPIGGVFRKYVLASRVRFLNGTPGVIGFDRLDNINELPMLDKVYIDVGATNKKDCPVKIGDIAAFERPFAEMGNRHDVNPDLGIAVDVTPTGDTPNGLQMEMALGNGPCVKFQDVGAISDPRLVQWMIAAAEKNKIPYQREVLLVGGTDAKAIQSVRAGVPSGCISIPVRYVHSPSEMVDYADVQNTVKLLTAVLRTPINLG